MGNRFGKLRVPNCECTYHYTCGPCMAACVERNRLDAIDARRYAVRHIETYETTNALRICAGCFILQCLGSITLQGTTLYTDAPCSCGECHIAPAKK